MKRIVASYVGFGAYGLFWGTWGATLPALRADAGVDEAGLGVALLFVGLAAPPAMLLTGRAVDRFGGRIAGALLIALALTGVLLAAMAHDLVTLAVGMALVGAASGAGDVAINALAGLAEQRSGKRVITVSHAVFSSFVVLGSLGAGALRASGAGALLAFALTGGGVLIAGAVVLALGGGPSRVRLTDPMSPRAGLRLALPFILVGLVGALGFAVENAHQSWSAIFLLDELGASPGLAAIAPATFAAFAAATRFAAGAATRIPSGGLLVGGAVVAAVGTLLLAIAPGVPVALIGLALAATGTSVLYPTLLSRATAGVPDSRRGRATSAVATTSYLGFVFGPVYVGVIAAATGLRGAMVAVAALAVAFALLAPVVTRTPWRERSLAPAAGMVDNRRE